jgi:hypothetical protein
MKAITVLLALFASLNVLAEGSMHPALITSKAMSKILNDKNFKRMLVAENGKLDLKSIELLETLLVPKAQSTGYLSVSDFEVTYKKVQSDGVCSEVIRLDNQSFRIVSITQPICD